MKEKIFQKEYLIILFAMILLITSILFVNGLLNKNVSYAEELSDIDQHWAREDIEFMRSKGSITGYPDGTFKPNNNVTVGEAIKLIVANFDNTIVNGEEHWASNYLKYAKENNIIKQEQYTINNLDISITRKEVMYMIINSLQNLAYKPIIENSDVKMNFNDMYRSINDDNIDYYEAIRKCYLLGIVIGDENNNMNPNENITRAELVTILTRAYNEGRRQYIFEYKTENLPSNSYNFTDMLKIMPNNFYENGNTTYAQYSKNGAPKYYITDLFYEYTKEGLKESKNNIDSAVSGLLNVSYDMTEEEWENWVINVTKFNDIIMKFSRNGGEIFEEYKKYVINNEITIKGGIIVDPLTFGNMKGEDGKYNLSVKGMVEYKVLSNPNNVKILTYADYINNKTSIYNKNSKYVLINILDEEYLENMNDMKFNISGITFVKEG